MKAKVSVLIIVIILIIIYWIPAPQGNFFELYNKEDNIARSLKEFYKKPVKTINIDGVKWKYLVAGDSDRTILFIHGMGGAYELWWQQVMAFEKDYRVITYTLPEEINSLDKAVKGIKAILDKENVNKFNVVGTSMGGYIAQYILKTMPERLEKVVFGNTFPPNDDIKKENETKSKVLKLLPEIVISYFGGKSLETKLLPAAKTNKEVLKSFLPSLPFSKESFLNRYKVVVDFFTINPCLYKYKRVPKLIIESDNDPLIPPKLRKELKELYSDAKVYTFHQEGHFPYINVPEEYNKIIRSFLEEPNKISAIETTVNNYFSGRKNADIELLKSIFHPGAKLMFSQNGKIKFIDFEDYLKVVQKDGKTDANTSILNVETDGNMGFVIAKFEYPVKTYIDYLTLLQENNKWKIVSKAFTKIK